jgi:hypothetical protein
MAIRRTVFAAALALGALTMAGCAPKTAEPAKAPDAAIAPVMASPALPVSINAVMVALVDHASEPLWVAAYKPPKTEADWNEAEYDAYQVAVTGKLIQLNGTGPSDAKWVADPNWRSDADAMSAAGMNALKAAQARDVKALDAAGSELVEACEDCHKQFKPSLTTGNLYKSPDYPAKK